MTLAFVLSMRTETLIVEQPDIAKPTPMTYEGHDGKVVGRHWCHREVFWVYP
jgi:hypothetical protein